MTEFNASTLGASVYTLRPLNEKAKDFKVESGNRLVRVIFKGKDAESKKAQFCQIPELSPAFCNTFAATEKGAELVKEMIEKLQDAAIKSVFNQFGRSPTSEDLSIEKLIEAAESDEDNVRCSKPNIEAAFEASYKNRIAICIAMERNAEAALILSGEDAEKIAEFWAGETGLKFLQIAANYKAFVLMAAERKPAFASAALKSKVVEAVKFLDSDVLVDKIVEKLEAAPVVTVDTAGL